MGESTIRWQTGDATDFITGPAGDILPDILKDRRAVLVVDKTVAELHGTRLPGDCPVLELVADERHKTLETVCQIHDFLMENNADRDTVLVAAGGGIVTDTAAFAAATYMRGMGLILVPTSLLGQVDAAIGGKTAVNYRGCKNLVGSFYQPERVLIDREFLLTLPVEEIQNGMAETIKHAAIRDEELWHLLQHIAPEQGGRSIPVPDLEILERSLRIKLDVVCRDEQESGMRKILNFGHTVGHIIEAETKYSHGQAVSIGMVIATAISHRLGLAQEPLISEMKTMLINWGLPTAVPDRLGMHLDKLLFDKKKSGNSITLVLLEEIGRPVLRDVPVPAIREVVHDLC